MTVGELLMALMNATTTGGVPEDAEVVIVVARANTGTLDKVITVCANKSQRASVILSGKAP